MGKAALIIVFGFSIIFCTVSINLNKYNIEAIDNFAKNYKETATRNCANSGVNIALSKLYRNINWRFGFEDINLTEGKCTVSVFDYTTDFSLSEMEIKIVAQAYVGDYNKQIETKICVAPELENLAVYSTDSLNLVNIFDEDGYSNTSIAVENAPQMIPFDKKQLINLAENQGNVYNENFTPANGYPNNNFFLNVINNVPNVTYVLLNLILDSNNTVYGIFITEGNVIINGNATLDGVLYQPNKGTKIEHNGDPFESIINGGIYSNGPIDGLSMLSIYHRSNYMNVFGAYQKVNNFFIISSKESF